MSATLHRFRVGGSARVPYRGRLQLSMTICDGIFQLSINDELEVEGTGLNWVGSYEEYGINAIFFENYWNQGSPVDQTRYFDNIIISTQPIGCGQGSIAPMPPSDVNIHSH